MTVTGYRTMDLNIIHIKMFLFVSDHSAQNGLFSEEFKPRLTEFCPWIGGDLQVYDANDDGYDDLTCHTSTGIIQITESHIVDTGMFNFRTIHSTIRLRALLSNV